MRLKPFSAWLVGLSFISSISGCGASAKQQADAAPAKSAAKELPKSAPQGTVAKAAEPVDEEVRTPATMAEAAQAIDLSTFPLLPGVQETSARTVARLEYTARIETFDLRPTYEFQRRNLLERQWKELGDSQISGQEASGQFSRLGLQISVSVRLHDERGKVVVRLQNHSNVNVSKLPVPPGAKLLGTSFGVTSFETTGGVEETREAVRKLLLEQGWQPYGSRGDRLLLKQNAVELTVQVYAPGARPGKAVIDYWAVQMSAD